MNRAAATWDVHERETVMSKKQRVGQDTGRVFFIAALWTMTILSTTPAARAGVCTPPEAPQPEADPYPDSRQVCQGGDNDLDYCAVAGDCPGGACVTPTPVGDRYLRLQTPASWAGKQIALRVTLLDLYGFPAFNGETRWVGTPQLFPEDGVRYGPDLMFLAGHLECAPVYRDWTTTDVINAYGSEVVPESLYIIQAIEAGCDEGNESNYSAPLLLRTAVWGETSAPWDGDGNAQPGFNDFYLFFPLFEGYATTESKAFAQLAPNELDPSRPLSALDLEAVSDGFLGNLYSTHHAGPDSCPHRVPACGDGFVDPTEVCDDGNLTPGDGCDATCHGENATLVVRVVPIDPPAETGLTYSSDVYVDGRDVYLASGGHRLWFELQSAGWTGQFTSYQLDLVDPPTNADGATLSYPYPACTPSFPPSGECVAAFGPGSTCWDYTGFAYCRWGFVNQDDPRWLDTQVFGEAEHRLAFAGAAIGTWSINTTDPRYVATFVLDVPEDAAGTYPVKFDRDVRATFLREQVQFGGIQNVPIAAYEDARIIVSTGCCTGTSCSNLGVSACLDSGGTPVPVCSGDCDGMGGDDVCGLANGTISDCNANGIPDTCETDCNANGIPDDCDLRDGTSLDCNDNTIPDECDIADDTSGDCNANDTPDECDIASGSSNDCNFDAVPDDCQPDEDCNNNTITDICDIGAGTSDDCDANLVPDECQPQDDCNNNSIQDICDLAAGTAFDCNDNQVLDSCDITDGTSLDDNADGVPDECCGPPAPVFVGHTKQRFLSLGSIGTPGVMSAIRITPVTLPGFEAFEGSPLWVGPPHQYPDEDNSQPGRTFTGAYLQCTPYYRDWSTIDVLQITGAEIIPEAEYEVQLVNEACDAGLESNFSLPLAAATGAFGDNTAPYAGGAAVQPDFGDISGAVDKFLATPGAPIKAAVEVQPNRINMNNLVNFSTIAAHVDAFLGTPYENEGFVSGPCTCPSSVTCGATACFSDVQCNSGTGFCVDSYCTDACGRCSP